MPYKVIDTGDSMWSVDSTADGVIHRDPASLGLYVGPDGYIAQTVKGDHYTSYGVDVTKATQRMASDVIGKEIENAITDYKALQTGLETIVEHLRKTMIKEIWDVDLSTPATNEQNQSQTQTENDTGESWPSENLKPGSFIYDIESTLFAQLTDTIDEQLHQETGGG